MVTSDFREGKTTVTLGLASALVNFGFRVLIVDGDFTAGRDDGVWGMPRQR